MTRNPAVQVMMGELASLVSIYESMLLAHEDRGADRDDGVLWPSKTALYSAMALQSELNGRMLETIRELAGAAMITLPSSDADFDNPEIAARHRALHALGHHPPHFACDRARPRATAPKSAGICSSRRTAARPR